MKQIEPMDVEIIRLRVLDGRESLNIKHPANLTIDIQFEIIICLPEYALKKHLLRVAILSINSQDSAFQSCCFKGGRAFAY